MFKYLKNINKNSYFIAVTIITICVFLLGVNNWPVGDDFCNKNRVDLMGIKNSTIEIYENWSGRILTTFLINIIFKYVSFSNLNYISGILGIIFVALIIKTTSFFYKDTHSIMKNFIYIFAVFWIGLKSVIGETVYWVTGGIVYLVPLFIFLIWVTYIQNLIFINQNKKINYFQLSVYILISLFIGNSIEPLSVAAIVFLLIIISIYYKNINKYTKIELFLIFISTIIGSAVLFLSKGNFQRLSKDNILTFNTDFNVLLNNFFLILYEYIKRGKILYIVILMTIPLISNNKKNNIKIGLIYLIMSLSTIIPITFIFSQNNFYSELRTTIFFLYFSAVGIIYIIKPIIKTKTLRNLLYILTSIFLITSIISQVKLAINIKKQFNIRETKIKTHYQDNVYKVETIKGEKPYTLKFIDITNNENYWINNCVAKYYKVPKIKI